MTEGPKLAERRLRLEPEEFRAQIRMYYRKRKPTTKNFYNFSSLGLKDLEKIKVYYYQNLAALEKRKLELIDIENKNKIIRASYELRKKRYLEYKDKNIKPIIDYIEQATAFLNQSRVNYLSLSNLIGNSVKWEGNIYADTKAVKEVISELERHRVLLSQYEEANPFQDYTELREIKVELPLLEKKLFRFGGVSHYVSFKSIDINFIELCIKSILDKEVEKQKEIDEIKARGAIKESETRKLAESFKRKYPLNRQLTILRDCPYCAKLLDKSNAHLEHIYPVSKGGKSSSKNLVWICSSCNLKKNDKTLSIFIKTHRMDRDKIEVHLDFLGKEY